MGADSKDQVEVEVRAVAVVVPVHFPAVAKRKAHRRGLLATAILEAKAMVLLWAAAVVVQALPVFRQRVAAVVGMEGSHQSLGLL